jgi:hypothetical protein
VKESSVLCHPLLFLTKDQWNERCKTQYKNSTNGFRRQQLKQQLEVMYQIHNQLMQRDQYIFQTPLEQWDDKTTRQLEDWIVKYQPVIRQCLLNAEKQLANSATDIRKFYPTTRNLQVTTVQPRRRKQRKPMQDRRTLRQKSLRTTPTLPPQLEHPLPRHRDTISTNILKNHTPATKITRFFTPTDNRNNHRKLAARERVADGYSISRRVELIPERVGDF